MFRMILVQILWISESFSNVLFKSNFMLLKKMINSFLVKTPDRKGA